MLAARRSRPSRAAESAGLDLPVLIAATLALRIPAFLAERHLTFDDGVYGASAVAMRAGGQPFRDVFSSQGPLFLPLVYAGDLLGLHTSNAPRVLSLVAAAVLVTATYLGARAITDQAGARLAAAVVSVTASVLWVTGPIAADGAALALATTTVALTLRWGSNLTRGRALWLGLGVGATVSVKALLAPVVVPVALVLLARRQLGLIAASALTAITSHLLLWLPWGPSNVWDQSYGYHLEVAGERTPGANLAKVVSTLGDRDLLVVALAVLALGALLARRRALPPPARGGLASPDVLLVGWLAGTALVLLAEHPLWRPHVSQLVPGLVLLAVRHRPSMKAILAAAVLVVPYHVLHAWPALAPTPYRAGTEQVLAILRDLPEGAQAMSDDPGVVWRAGRLTPPDLVDASILRLEAGDLTSTSLAATASQAEVCAVVVRSRVRWGSLPDLPDRLAAAGYELAFDDAAGGRVYLRAACAPG